LGRIRHWIAVHLGVALVVLFVCLLINSSVTAWSLQRSTLLWELRVFSRARESPGVMPANSTE